MSIARARTWWVTVLRGLCAVLLGCIALALPGMTLVALVMLFGAYAFGDGLLAIVGAVRAVSHERPWWPLLIEGLVGIAIGLLTFFWPSLTTMTLLYLIAIWAILTGVLELVAAIRMHRPMVDEWLLVVVGVLSIAFGLYMLANPVAGALALVWMIGVYALAFGLVMVVLGTRRRTRQQQPSAPPTERTWAEHRVSGVESRD